jgi:hypothetical protein
MDQSFELLRASYVHVHWTLYARAVHVLEVQIILVVETWLNLRGYKWCVAIMLVAGSTGSSVDFMHHAGQPEVLAAFAHVGKRYFGQRLDGKAAM